MIPTASLFLAGPKPPRRAPDWEAWVTFGIFAIFSVLILVLTDYLEGVIFITAPFVWFMGVLIARRRGAMPEMTDRAITTIGVVPLLFGFTFMTGLTDGGAALRQTDNIYLVKLKEENDEKKWPVLRNLTRGLLVHDTLTTRVIFHKWEDISVLSRWAYPPMNLAPSCKYLGINCRFETITP
jgi:hypothetical protein